jgi:hypothetical protein
MPKVNRARKACCFLKKKGICFSVIISELQNRMLHSCRKPDVSGFDLQVLHCHISFSLKWEGTKERGKLRFRSKNITQKSTYSNGEQVKNNATV